MLRSERTHTLRIAAIITIKTRELMRYLNILVLFFSFTMSLSGQNYRVAIATYFDTLVPPAIRDAAIPGVFKKVDQNALIHYYVGDYYTIGEAERVRANLLAMGFVDASVIDLEEQRAWCGSPCPYFREDGVYSHIGSDGLMVAAIFFETGSRRIGTKGSKVIHELTKILKDNPSYSVLIEGHADSRGNRDVNNRIALRRALSALNLFKDYGIRRERARVLVFGDRFPLKGDPKYDRRVVLAILDETGQIVSRSRIAARKHLRRSGSSRR